MSRRFVIGVDSLDKDQKAKFRRELGRYGGWWNWIENMWLLHTSDNADISASKIVDIAERINPEARTIVIEFPEDLDWSGRGRNAKGANIYDWLLGPWSKD